VVCGRGRDLVVSDADEDPSDDALHRLRFLRGEALERVAVLAALVAEVEVEPAVSFLERGQD
jgi:hypothetical protein